MSFKGSQNVDFWQRYVKAIAENDLLTLESYYFAI